MLRGVEATRIPDLDDQVPQVGGISFELALSPALIVVCPAQAERTADIRGGSR
jgi:hypothetical protein